MRLLKKQVLLRLLNSYVVDSPQPANLSYLWNFGSLLATCLILQILTGIFLAMHYIPNVDLAFTSVEHIMRDVNNGWAVRYTHANVASFFFIFVYAQTQFYLFDYLNNYSCHRPFNNIDLFKKIIDDFLNAIKPKPIKSSSYKTTTNIKDVDFFFFNDSLGFLMLNLLLLLILKIAAGEKYILHSR